MMSVLLSLVLDFWLFSGMIWVWHGMNETNEEGARVPCLGYEQERLSEMPPSPRYLGRLRQPNTHNVHV